MTERKFMEFRVIADQDGNPYSIARKLVAFWQEGLRDGWIAGRFRDLPLGTSIDEIRAAWYRTGDDGEGAWNLLEDLIATVDRRIERPFVVSWHPDYSGTLVCALDSWFNDR
jgi:hypothetical protein